MRPALGQLGRSGLPLDRVVHRVGWKPRGRKAHREPGPASLPMWLSVMLGFLVIRPVL